jgi:hypothetical protein
MTACFLIRTSSRDVSLFELEVVVFSTHLSSARLLFIRKELFQVADLNFGPGAFSAKTAFVKFAKRVGRLPGALSGLKRSSNQTEDHKHSVSQATFSTLTLFSLRAQGCHPQRF